MDSFHGTTILSVRRQTPQGWQVALGGDGQVTLGTIVVKASARKVRRLHRDTVLAGFAGATADAFTLFERFEAKLEKHQGHLVRSAIELTKDWRTDRVLDILVPPPRDSRAIGFGGVLRLGALAAHLTFALLLDGDVDEIAHDRIDVLADVADLGELRGFDFEKRRAREFRQASRDFGFTDASRADHQDVFRQHLLAQFARELLAPPAVAQRNRNRALGVMLTDDIAVEIGRASCRERV